MQITKSASGKATFDDFTNYLNILLNGTTLQKAVFSFNMISNHKAKITYEDIEKLVFDVSSLWNGMTGSKAIPTQTYIDEIY